jgi:hypothetical protein
LNGRNLNGGPTHGASTVAVVRAVTTLTDGLVIVKVVVAVMVVCGPIRVTVLLPGLVTVTVDCNEVEVAVLVVVLVVVAKVTTQMLINSTNSPISDDCHTWGCCESRCGSGYGCCDLRIGVCN